MRSKNSKSLTKKEKDHLFRIKNLDCACCGASGPCHAHHIKQGQHFSCIPLCDTCHMPPIGLHGDRSLMRVYKLSELDMLANTIMRLT